MYNAKINMNEMYTSTISLKLIDEW